jgi:uncharacterized protein (TIGR04255 family)
MSREPEDSGDLSGRLVPGGRYAKPPVIEALCEIYFAGRSWDSTVPGRFYERVKTDFPERRQRVVQEALITMGPEQATAGLRQLPPWMQFVSDERHRMIQLAENLLVVNQLSPYPRFEEWEADVFRALRVYRELAQPETVVRMGLRYINRVVIPGERIRMADYFTIYPHLPPSLGDTHGSFMVRVEVPQSAQGHTVVITFGTAPPPSAGDAAQAFMLDLYDILHIGTAVDEEVVKRELRQAHANIGLAFEDSITDALRKLFEPEEPT